MAVMSGAPASEMARAIQERHGVFEEPPFARWLFADTRSGLIWLVLRLWLGWEWLQAGLHKVGAPGWTGPEAGKAVTGFLQGALAKTTGEHPDVSGWWAWFIQHVALPNAKLFAWLVAWGEVLVGIALILGVLTGIAAFFGTFMNVAFLFSGTVSSNPIMFVVGTWLVLAWRVAGWYGLDRWVLPALGTPWHPGSVFEKKKA